MVQGAVIYHARVAVNLTNGTFAAALNVSSPTITHLELGVIATTTFHLDIIAYVLTAALREQRGPAHPGWIGWQLMHVATLVTDVLEQQGHVCYWDSPRREMDLDQFLHGPEFAEKIRSLWPPEYLDRL